MNGHTNNPADQDEAAVRALMDVRINTTDYACNGWGSPFGASARAILAAIRANSERFVPEIAALRAQHEADIDAMMVKNQEIIDLRAKLEAARIEADKWQAEHQRMIAYHFHGVEEHRKQTADLRAKLELAERTLTGAGWSAVVGCDGPAWKPPLGNKPEWLRIEELTAELAALSTERDEWRDHFQRAESELAAERERRETAEKERDSLIKAICGDVYGPGNEETTTKNAIRCLKTMREESSGYEHYIITERDDARAEADKLRAELTAAGERIAALLGDQGCVQAVIETDSAVRALRAEIAALKARTVKLPEIRRAYDDVFADGREYQRRADADAIRAAGVQVEGDK